LGVNWPELERQLRRLLPAPAVVSARQELLAYDCDGLTLKRHQPRLVVLPESTEQVAAVVRLCHELEVPFVARGSGTGLSGGAVAETDALVIATSRMRLVLAVDLENRRITVQPGVINSWVTRAVAGDGFYYAPTPPARWPAASVATWLKTPAGCTASSTASPVTMCLAWRWCCPTAR